MGRQETSVEEGAKASLIGGCVRSQAWPESFSGALWILRDDVWAGGDSRWLMGPLRVLNDLSFGAPVGSVAGRVHEQTIPLAGRQVIIVDAVRFGG